MTLGLDELGLLLSWNRGSDSGGVCYLLDIFSFRPALGGFRLYRDMWWHMGTSLSARRLLGVMHNLAFSISLIPV